MFGTIRRHQTWLWLVIATITIISMVAYLGPGGRANRGSGRTEGNYGTLNGRPITADQLSDAAKEVRLAYFVRTGQRFPDSESVAVQREVYLRLFLISQLKELGIEPGDKSVAEFAARMTGSTPMADFVDKYLKPQGFDGNDFARFLHHELGIEQLVSTTGLAGRMVTSQEAEALYRANHKELTTALVYFAATNFVNAVTVTPQAIAEYYTNQMNLSYHLRDRVQVDYVKFANSNYVAAAAAGFTNLDKNINEAYAKYGTNLFPGLTNEADIKLRLKTDALDQRAALEARRAAGMFAQSLDTLTNKSPDDLARLAAASKLTVQTTPPFDDEGSKDLDVPPAFVQTAFMMNSNEPFAGPVTNSEAAFVLALKRKLPSEIEPLDQIKARVTDDYRNAEAVKLALQAADKFHTVLTNGLSRSNRFDAICASAQVKPEALPPISLSSTNLPPEIERRVSLGLLQRVAFGTPVGSASQVVNLPDGAFILYCEKESPVNEVKVLLELPQFLAYLRQTRQNEAFNQWLGERVHQDRDFEAIMQDFYNKQQPPAQGARRSP
jgi:hypothetical protein